MKAGHCTGRIELKKLNAGSKSQKTAYVIILADGRFYELRMNNEPGFQNHQKSVFRNWLGKAVTIDGLLLNRGLFIVEHIQERKD